MNEEEIRVIKLFKALCNPARFMIIKKLADGDTSSGDLCTLIKKTDSATSQHLRLLKNLDIVKYYMKGSNVVYSLKKKFIADLLIKLEKFYLREKTL